MEKQEDGWDDLSQSSEEDGQLVSLYKENEGRNILHQQYSLEPDMLTGWMPKLPSCPIPLTYQNKQTEQICELLEKDKSYEIVYKGKRFINSVQLHKRYDYKWKYRERYEIKVNIITEAVNNVGLLQDSPKIENLIFEKRRDDQMSFDCNFESGNLDLAVRIKKNEYDCFIRSDTNTKGHTNWYYFKVCNKKCLGTTQFNICNIVKRRNLYGKGMNPYSKVVELGTKSNEWTQNQCYSTQFVQRLCRYGTGKTTNQLQFKFDFHRENMEVYFAYSIPYSYTDLLEFIQQIKPHPFVKITSACQSFSGLDLPLITISNQSSHKKSGVILTARIHPGETNSSHMLEGFIRSLLENSPISHKLLSFCNFYIVPMLNPDGVTAGNYRTSFSGRDLNRKFDEIGNFLYPQINGLVDLVKRLKKQRQKVDFFFDFHSHSSKKNLFCYGPEHQEGTSAYLRSRVLVKILSRQDSMFEYEKCISFISEYKKTTARAYMLRKQAIPMTFTFQISNGLFSLTKDIESTYDKASLYRAGKIVFQGLSQYSLFYLRQFQNAYKSSARSSLNLNKKIPLLRKMTVRRSQNLSTSCQFLSANNNELKEILEEITLEGEAKPAFQEKFSDHEESDNDMDEGELKELFALRMKYISELEDILGQNNQKRSNIRTKSSLKMFANQSTAKNQLMKASSEKVLTKLSLNLQKKMECNLVSPPSTTAKPGKYKKNRIYYEETHPPTMKKVSQNSNPMKKAIKQKKFPIIF